MHAAPKAKDCWEGHRPHAILTARTARLLRWTPASCAGRWAAGWATATTSIASKQSVRRSSAGAEVEAEMGGGRGGHSKLARGGRWL